MKAPGENSLRNIVTCAVESGAAVFSASQGYIWLAWFCAAFAVFHLIIAIGWIIREARE